MCETKYFRNEKKKKLRLINKQQVLENTTKINQPTDVKPKSTSKRQKPNIKRIPLIASASVTPFYPSFLIIGTYQFISSETKLNSLIHSLLFI
jgi:hypothetical protein